MILSKAMEAERLFNEEGRNCCQAVFSTYCEQLGLDRETALKLTLGMGGGMGKLGGTCGAVTGAYLLIGLITGGEGQADRNAINKAAEMVREFAAKFKERNEYTDCAALLGFDPLTADPHTASLRKAEICPKLIRDSAELIEELLSIK